MYSVSWSTSTRIGGPASTRLPTSWSFDTSAQNPQLPREPEEIFAATASV
jgi:hypothetical protein